jgi:streptogramin lyase
VIAFSAAGCATKPAGPALAHVLAIEDLESGIHVAGLAVGPAGDLWIATLNYGNGPSGVIVRRAGGSFQRFSRVESFNGVAVDRSDAAWLTVGAGASGQQPKLVRIDRAGRMHDYPLPEEGNYEGIAIGPDGAPWFADASGGDIGRMGSGGVITYYGPASGDPTEIASGKDGNLWFTEPASNKIGRLTPQGALTEFRVPTAGARPAGIAAGADGNMWFCESAADKIGRITPGGHITEFRVPTANAWPAGIASGRDESLWFTELSTAKIGRISKGGSIQEFAAPGGGYPGPIAAAPDGSLWVASNAKRDAAFGLAATRSRIIHFY